VGSGDNTSLPAYTVPARWNPGWPAWQPGNCGEARQEPPKAHLFRDGRETGKRTESCKIRGVLCTNSGPFYYHRSLTAATVSFFFPAHFFRGTLCQVGSPKEKLWIIDVAAVGFCIPDTPKKPLKEFC